MKLRKYGDSGPVIVLLHGGPGAPGSMAPLARELANSFRVFEPFQRPSVEGPVGVADHVADLRDLIVAQCEGVPPALIGHSWGAMLALAFAAAHPRLTGPLALIGCGTFDPAAREVLRKTIDERLDDSLRSQIERLAAEYPDADQRLGMLAQLLLPVYSYSLISSELETEGCDATGHEETWADMVRLQSAGVYPGAFASIRGPVLMLHGAADPHPGRLIRAILERYLPQLEYREWEKCGHYPWLEAAVREEFLSVLRGWLREGDLGSASRV